MSFFKKAMANVLGVGGSKVDTILHNNRVCPGDTISGTIKIFGGNIEQYINGVNLIVRTKFEKKSNDKNIIVTQNIQKIPVAIGRSVTNNDNLEIPFSFKLDENCPISVYKYPVWISTVLDIANAIDSGDGDNIEVVPSNEIKTILDILSNIGFRRREIENISNRRRINNMPFVQEFEFVAQTAPFRGKLDEIEIVFAKNMYGVDLYIQIDRRAHSIGSLFAEKLNLDESNIKLEIQNHEFNDSYTLKEKIFATILQYS